MADNRLLLRLIELNQWFHLRWQKSVVCHREHLLALEWCNCQWRRVQSRQKIALFYTPICFSVSFTLFSQNRMDITKVYELWVCVWFFCMCICVSCRTTDWWENMVLATFFWLWLVNHYKTFVWRKQPLTILVCSAVASRTISSLSIIFSSSFNLFYSTSAYLISLAFLCHGHAINHFNHVFFQAILLCSFSSPTTSL